MAYRNKTRNVYIYLINLFINLHSVCDIEDYRVSVIKLALTPTYIQIGQRIRGN